MKNKKTISAICAAIALSSACALFAGCGGGKSKEHTVNRWTPSLGRESTCATDGEEQGECIDCGEIIFRTLPADPSDLTKHDYGEWAIVKPTEASKGSATKTCSRSCTQNNTYTVELPVLSDSSYTVQTIAEESVVSEGVYKYTLKNDLGDITFEVTVDKLPIEDVGDAVDTAVSKAATIRQTNANVLDEELYSRYSPEIKGREVTCYFGDNYVHSTDPREEVDDWYSYDLDGKVLGIRTYNRGLQDEDGTGSDEVTVSLSGANESNMKGFNFSIFHSGINGFGAEDFLKELYAAGHMEGAIGYAEKTAHSNGGVYEFSFAATNDTLYNELTVKFTLADGGALDTLNVFELAYERYKYDENFNVLTDEEGQQILEESGHGPVPHYVSSVSIAQTPKREGELVPENVYDYRKLYISDFTALLYGKEVNGEKATEIQARKKKDDSDESYLYPIEITDVKPASASFAKENPLVYLREANMPDVLLSEDAKISVLFGGGAPGTLPDTEEGKYYLFVNSKIKGEFTLVIKTSGGCEKELKFNAVAAPPESGHVVIDYYEYSDATGEETYTWTQFATNSEMGGVYTGQPLMFKLGMDKENTDAVAAESFTDLGFTAKVTKNGVETDAVTIEYLTKDDIPELAAGVSVAKITAKEVGEYKLTLTSTANDKVSKNLWITVEEAPSYSTIFAAGKVYNGRITYPQIREVTVTVNGGSTGERGSVTVCIDKVENVVINYRTDEATGALLTEVDAANSAISEGDGVNYYNFTLDVNSAFKVVLKQPTFKDSETGETYFESYILYEPEA